jgi:hypothetical protein
LLSRCGIARRGAQNSRCARRAQAAARSS